MWGDWVGDGMWQASSSLWREGAASCLHFWVPFHAFLLLFLSLPSFPWHILCTTLPQGCARHAEEAGNMADGDCPCPLSCSLGLEEMPSWCSKARGLCKPLAGVWFDLGVREDFLRKWQLDGTWSKIATIQVKSKGNKGHLGGPVH